MKNESQLEKLELALNNLKKAFIEMNETYAEDSTEFLNTDESVKDYPFNQSFDDLTLGVIEWVNNATRNINIERYKEVQYMYASINFKTKKEFREYVENGGKVSLFSAGLGNPLVNGMCAVEGQWYPKPHRWWAEVVVKDGIVTKVK